MTETRLDWQEKLIRTIMRYIGILHDVKIPSNETSAAIATATKATQSKTTLTQLSKLQLSISQVLPLPACLICMHVCLCVVGRKTDTRHSCRVDTTLHATTLHVQPHVQPQLYQDIHSYRVDRVLT